MGCTPSPTSGAPRKREKRALFYSVGCKLANLQPYCKSADVCKFANFQTYLQSSTCRFANLQNCKFATVYKFANLEICRFVNLQIYHVALYRAQRERKEEGERVTRNQPSGLIHGTVLEDLLSKNQDSIQHSSMKQFICGLRQRRAATKRKSSSQIGS